MAAPQTSVSVSPDIGVPGQIPDLAGVDDAMTLSATSREASASIPFGVMVKKGTGDEDALLMTSAADVLLGVTAFAHDFAIPTELDPATGLRPGSTFSRVFWGPVLVRVEDAVTPASEVHVRISANGLNTQAGSFRGTADAGHTIDATPFARYLSSAGAAGVAILFLSLPNSALATAD